MDILMKQTASGICSSCKLCWSDKPNATEFKI